MSRADELRRQADALDRHEVLVEAYEMTLAAYRADPSEDARAAYREAAQALQEWRAVDRADRAAGHSVGGDASDTTVEG